MYLLNFNLKFDPSQLYNINFNEVYLHQSLDSVRERGGRGNK